MPSVAGVSSFGFGGANAHVVLEAYQPATTTPKVEDRQVVVTLSAKDQERLVQVVKNLYQYLETPAGQQANLSEIAFTTQMGRDALEERLALVVDSKPSLSKMLAQFTQGNAPLGVEMFAGNIEDHNPSALMLSGEPGKAFIAQAIAGQQLSTLAQLWVQGKAIDWKACYGQQRPRTISLPTYPFARQRYWYPHDTTATKATGATPLHPLVHRIVPGFEGITFESGFTGHEPYFTDHKVMGVKVLPGAGQIELIREVGERSLGKKVTTISDIVFQKPIEGHDEGLTIQARLRKTGRLIEYDIIQPSTIASPEVYSSGQLGYAPLAPAPKVDINHIMARTTQQLRQSEYYAMLLEKGIDYGTSFQGIQSLWYNSHEVLSQIALPKQLNYVLPPDLLDSAVQTVMGLSFGFDRTKPANLPFSVKMVKIYAPLPERFWSHARKNAPEQSDGMPTYDVDLIDESGTILVSFIGFVALLARGQQPESKDLSNPIADVLYMPTWERVQLSSPSQPLSGGRHWLVSGEDSSSFEALLAGYLIDQDGEVLGYTPNQAIPSGLTHLYLLHGLAPANQNGLRNEIEKRELAVFRLIKALLGSEYARQPLAITVFTDKTQKIYATAPIQQLGSGITGLIGTLAKEQPNWTIRIIDIDLENAQQQDVERLLSLPPGESGMLTGYRQGRTYTRNLYPVALSPNHASKLKQGGTYVILGGAGGIGKVTTQYLMAHYNAHVIWLGRRPHSKEIQLAQESVSVNGKMPHYISCDANDPNSMQNAYQQAKAAYPTINGLFHSALILNDMSLGNMAEQDFLKAFEPKAIGSHHFVEAFQSEPLDFICFYSSLQSQVNAAGQANYSAGCTYKDSYAHSIQQAMNTAVHIINWGYWGEVGVVSSAEYQQKMDAIGMGSITPEEGMKILEAVLANEHEQIVATKFTRK